MANIQSVFSALPLKSIEEVEHLEMLLDAKNLDNVVYFKQNLKAKTYLPVGLKDAMIFKNLLDTLFTPNLKKQFAYRTSSAKQPFHFYKLNLCDVVKRNETIVLCTSLTEEEIHTILAKWLKPMKE